ncbi:extracellular solute-binding protein [Planctomicrobium piriforme]|uniref:Iron(III) transport system substrate-binding protein n=1 Tax=Planctomicrobium piriforme TaxID=1576369 RepID=A0A1I3BZL8_9PLAN|nr:extracellular solute-binding protein [Planctomicrobium piriforme]SFH67757.1 iron(III) transport system substrate-binding protein [Planctomicrobium piriforme]
MKTAVGVSLFLLAVGLGWAAVSERRQGAVVVYCAHDLDFAQQILDDFTKATGINVVVVGDTEATKSVGLVERLLAERDHPRCDLFWNNEPLGTMLLAEQGLLEPYRGSGYDRMDEMYRDPEGRWVGFAGRLRVWIINREKMSATHDAVIERFIGSDLSRFAIAKPLFGTTLTHCSIVWKHDGEDTFQNWFRSLHPRGAQIVPGNGPVKNLVAQGACDFGWTDTDDFFIAKDDGAPVEMIPIRIESETICLPNTVAIMRGAEHLKEAQQLADYLLSKETELKLAKSASRQIPLGDEIDDKALPEDVRKLLKWSAEALDFRRAAAAREPCLKWLRQELTQ